jgi:hypothetical protein
MSGTEQKPSRKRLKKAAPVVGVVGASMALAGGTYAMGVANASPNAAADDTTLGPQINLSEEELSDVSLGTFYIFDKEGTGKLGEQLAARCGGGGGCRCGGGGCRCGGGAGRCAGGARCAGGCGGCRGCRGCSVGGCRSCIACGGCSGCSCGCCISWGACRWIC